MIIIEFVELVAYSGSKKMAGMRGFEPLQTEPESVVLPLDDIPTMAGPGGFEPPNAWTKTMCVTA